MNVGMPAGFEAISVLGQGAMGKVYKAWQPKLQRHVAVKTCRIDQSEERGQDPGRLEDEALTIASLSHPNIVALYDVARDDEAIYLIMEYLEGAPLSRILSPKYPATKLDNLLEVLDLEGMQALQSDRRLLTNDWVTRVGIGVARALKYAHSRGILHRDVKPGNIVITHDFHVKLLDFSIARGRTKGKRTTTGVVFGTVQYMSPEQVLGNSLDERTDIYALGCTLFHAATGRLPFDDDNDIAVCMSHVHRQPDDPAALNPFLNPAIGRVILKCMEKSPDMRYAGAGQVEADLTAVMRGVRPSAETENDSYLADASASEDSQAPWRTAGSMAYGGSIASSTASPSRPSPVITPRPVRTRQAMNLEEMAAMADTDGSETERLLAPPSVLASDPMIPMIKTRSGYLIDVPDPAPHQPNMATALDKDRRKRAIALAGIAAVALLALLATVAVLALRRSHDAQPSAPPLRAAIDSPAETHVDATAVPAVTLPEPAPPEETQVAVVIPPRAASESAPIAAPAPRTTPAPEPLQLLSLPPLPEPDPGIYTFRLQLPGGAELTMAELPPGTFLMGAPSGEPGRTASEGPQTQVTFAFPFYISEAEITAAQFRAVMGAEAIAGPDALPAERVSALEADEFCRRLSDFTGLRVLLPTEAQWEYACRAGTDHPFAFGPILTSEVANIDGRDPLPRAPASQHRGRALAPRSLPSNAWKLYEMHGNVWELTRTPWSPTLGERSTAASPSQEPALRVLRGGGYDSPAVKARSAARASIAPEEKRAGVGFRVVVEL